jgi:hypothetical protein
MRFFLLCLGLTCLSVMADSQSRDGLIKPCRVTMKVPDDGFVWLEGEGFEGTCDSVPDTAWTRWSSKDFDLCVFADGPGGSGRFWTITVGLSKKHESRPERGFCFETSTVGWRTLRYEGSLRWIDDRDGDGKPELIIWDSFPLHEEASMAEYGLVAWVYQVQGNGRFQLDWKLTRAMAAELASSYRRPLVGSDMNWQNLRLEAAEALEALASGE